MYSFTYRFYPREKDKAQYVASYLALGLLRLSLVVLLSMACTGHYSFADGQKPVPQPLKLWKIVFVRDGSVWVANGDGAGQRLVIRHGASPSWSPDKKQIAFSRAGNIWVASADGAKQRQLTRLSKPIGRKPDDSDIEISWRPGTDQLTFSRPEEFRIRRVGGHEVGSQICSSIYDVCTDPEHKQRLEVRYDIGDGDAGARFSDNSGATWSPDGNTLVFCRNGDIWISARNADPGLHPGFDCSRLSAVASYDAPTYRVDRSNEFAHHLSWSPDGKAVVYDYGRAMGDEEIHMLALDRAGTECMAGEDRMLVRSTSERCGEWPKFSPDGAFVAYQRWDGVYVISVDGTYYRKLIPNAEQPDW